MSIAPFIVASSLLFMNNDEEDKPKKKIKKQKHKQHIHMEVDVSNVKYVDERKYAVVLYLEWELLFGIKHVVIPKSYLRENKKELIIDKEIRLYWGDSLLDYIKLTLMRYTGND